jgi:hypothetical protein
MEGNCCIGTNELYLGLVEGFTILAFGADSTKRVTPLAGALERATDDGQAWG